MKLKYFDICVYQMRDVIFTLYYFILETECSHKWECEDRPF